jgi:hypothetical protein
VKAELDPVISGVFSLGCFFPFYGPVICNFTSCCSYLFDTMSSENNYGKYLGDLATGSASIFIIPHMHPHTYTKMDTKPSAGLAVSWADLIAVAGAEAVAECDGPRIPVGLGRHDSV